MAWNDLTREEMEAQLLRQSQTIGVFREALEKIAHFDYRGHRPQQNVIAFNALRAAERLFPK